VSGPIREGHPSAQEGTGTCSAGCGFLLSSDPCVHRDKTVREGTGRVRAVGNPRLSGSPWVRILRGQAYDGAGAYNKALEEFEEAKKQLPTDATARFSLEFMCWKLRRFSEAESELQENLRLDPHFTQARYYLADTYLMDLKPELALPILRNLVREFPEDYRARVDFAKAAEKLSRYQDAVPQFQEAIRLGPTHADPRYLLGRTYQKLKRMDDSRRELELAQKVQAEERTQVESLIKGTGARGDPARGLGLAPPPKQEESSPAQP